MQEEEEQEDDAVRAHYLYMPPASPVPGDLLARRQYSGRGAELDRVGALTAAKGKLAALDYRVDDLRQAIAQLDRVLAPAPVAIVALHPPRPIHAVTAAPEIAETIRFPSRLPASPPRSNGTMS